MTSVSSELQWVCIRLIPFFASVGVYFTLLIPYERPSVWAVIIKCIPIISLMYFVATVGFKNGYNAFASRILAGLILCCIGDGLLLWNRTFVHGMTAFILGHLNYIWAFGFVPLRLNLGIFIFTLGGIVVSLLYPGLTGVLKVGVPVYILVINTMIWRASARILQPWTWPQLSTCIGSILFAMSDLMIGVDRFIRPIPYSQVFYITQLDALRKTSNLHCPSA